MNGGLSLMTAVSPDLSASLGKTSSTMQHFLPCRGASGPRADIVIIDFRDELFGLEAGIPDIQGSHLC